MSHSTTPKSVAPATKAGKVSKGTDLAQRALRKDALTKRERQFISCMQAMSDSFFSVKYVLGPRHMTACVYQQEPQPARRQAAVSTADAPARERTVRMQDEHEEPERDGTYTTVQPKAKRKAPPRAAPAAAAKPKPKPKPKQPKVDKNTLSACTDGGNGGGSKGSYADVTKALVVATKSARPRSSPPLSPERTSSSPPRKSPRGSGVASEVEDSEMESEYDPRTRTATPTTPTTATCMATTTARAPARTLGTMGDTAAGGPIPLHGPQSSAGRRVRNSGSPDGGRAGTSSTPGDGSTAVLC